MAEITEAQQEWIDCIESYPNWMLDKEPYEFVTHFDGLIRWYRNGFQGLMRIRISKNTCTMYKVTMNGQETMTYRYYVPDLKPEQTNIIKYLDTMLVRVNNDKRLKGMPELCRMTR